MGKEERTICRVTRLDQGEREHELARMLGGIHHLSAALENARALIKMANAESKPKLVSLAKPPSAKAEKKTGAAISAPLGQAGQNLYRNT